MPQCIVHPSLANRLTDATGIVDPYVSSPIPIRSLIYASTDGMQSDVANSCMWHRNLCCDKAQFKAVGFSRV